MLAAPVLPCAEAALLRRPSVVDARPESVTALVLLMLFCYLILKREDSFQLPVADLTVPLMAYVLLSFANFARGIVIGHHALKESTLELLPVLALATAPLVGNAFVAARDLRFSVGTLVVLSYASASLGYAAVTGVRQGKLFEVQLDAADEAAARRLVSELCEKLLANPVIETHRIVSVEP